MIKFLKTNKKRNVQWILSKLKLIPGRSEGIRVEEIRNRVQKGKGVAMPV
jgi:hypothetical protein